MGIRLFDGRVKIDDADLGGKRPCGKVGRGARGGRRRWRRWRRWRDSLISADGPVLILTGEFAPFAWHWRLRVRVTVSDYSALSIRRGVTVAHWDDGSHMSQWRLP